MVDPNWIEREEMVSEDKQEDLWGASVADWAEHEADHAPSWEAMLSNMNVQKGAYLLDAGCGAGGGAKSAIDLGAQVFGIDKSPAMISYAKTHVPLADFRVGDLEKMPYGDNFFDAVMAGNSVQYAQNPSNALREIRRICKLDGKISICTWDVAEKNDQHLLRATIEKYMPKQSKPGAGPFTLAASGVLEKLVESAGLEVISGEIVPITFYLEDLENLVRKQLSTAAGQNALATLGPDLYRNAINEFYEEHQGDDGVLRINNQFRFVTATPL